MSAFTKDTRLSDSAPRILLYSSCVAEQLRDYLLSKPEISGKYAVDVLLIHVLELDGVAELEGSVYAPNFLGADIVATNCFSPKWKGLGYESVHNLSGGRVLTWVPPNFAAFWPVVEHFGEEGVLRMLQCGFTQKDIIEAFDSNVFDPLFHQRFYGQLARLTVRETGCDMRISRFVERHHRARKMFFTENHPCYSVVAWLGSQLMEKIGLPHDSEEDCLNYPHDKLGVWNTWPETSYEFDHFKFEYPRLYDQTQHWGNRDWYRSVIARICDRVASGKP